MSAFLVSQKTMNRVVAALDKNNEQCSVLDKLGNDLFDLNYAAMQERYGERAGDRPDKFEFKPVGVLTASGKIQLLKSLNCLIYQCSEGDVPERPLFARLEKRRDELMSEVVHALPEYDKAEWD